MKTATTFLMAILLTMPSLGLACGFCGGDKAASVYSFKNKKFTERTKSTYVSVELTGKGDEENFHRALEALGKVKGVYPKTIRSAYAQKAASFVYEPQLKFDDLAAEFSEKVPGWSMKLVEEIH